MSGADDLDGDLPERRAPQDAIVRVLEIVNKKGLHARASAKFVQTVERFDANVKVTRGGETVGRHLDHGPDDARRRDRHHDHRRGHRQRGRGGRSTRSPSSCRSGFGEED